MAGSRPPGWADDIASAAAITGVDELAVEGFILVVMLDDGSTRLAHTTCCNVHAIGHLVVLITDGMPPLVRCSGEQ